MIKILHFVAGAILLFLTNTGISSEAVAIDNPATSILKILDKLDEFSQTAGINNQNQLHNFIKRNILSHFALEEMSRWISGPYSRHMSLVEKNEFRTQLEKAFLNTISNNIGSFKTIKSRVTLSKTQYKTENIAIVGAQIKLYNDTPVKLDLHMKNSGSAWKIIDIKINGTSALIYYRQHFIQQLRAYAKN